MVSRGEVWLVALDPTVGSEVQKTRPCVILSPDELNRRLRTVLAAPMTTGGWAAKFRVELGFEGRQGRVLLDQLRTVDARRLLRRLGNVSPNVLAEALKTLRTLFED